MSAPAFYDDLDAALAEAWRLLAQGVADRRSALHHPTLASIGRDGAPQARTVILRACDAERRELRFHTDLRSRKAAEIAADPRVSLHAYDPDAKIQLRLRGRASLHADDALADAAWDASRPISRQCYGIAPGPGTGIAAGGDYDLPEVGAAAGRENFAAAVVAVDRLEWVYLAIGGHRRARFDWTTGRLQAGWLTP